MTRDQKEQVVVWIIVAMMVAIIIGLVWLASLPANSGN